MRDHIWRSMTVICLVQGFATALSPYAGMVAGLFVAIYLASRFWFVDHPVILMYDLVFYVVLLVVAFLGAVVYTGICYALPFTGVTTRTCQSLDFTHALCLHAWILGLIGGLLWLLLRTWVWWKLRHR